MNNTKIREYDSFILFILIIFISGIYFYLFGNYVFFYQENLSLFVFSSDYLKQFIVKPGGLLEYCGNFISQGYFNNLYGAIVQAAVFTLIAYVFLRINKRLLPGKSFPVQLFAAIVAGILIIMQANFNYRVHHSLGFISAGLVFLFSISSEKKLSRVLLLAFFPMFFYLTGAFAFIYLGMFIIYGIIKKNFILPLSQVIIAALTLLLFKEVIFFQPWQELLYYPLPQRDQFVHPSILWLLYLFFIFYPLLLILVSRIRIKEKSLKKVRTGSILGTFVLTVFVLTRMYSNDTAEVFRIEKMFFARDWDGVIREQELCRSKNLVAQYYYNTALAEKGILCDRMFFAPQDYGINGIMIAWNSRISINRLFRGVYFYYSVGLINEAHRWAFESMVIQGYRPENIKLLIKTNLINGHYKIAEKYIEVLKRTLHYRNLADKYAAMINNPELIRSDPELGEKLKLKPRTDFLIRIRNPEANIVNLLQSNPGNRKAYEYQMACFMLSKNMEGIVNHLKRLNEMGYSKIPRHIEEAALFISSNTPFLPDLRDLKISYESGLRFSDYISYLMYRDRTRLKEGSGIKKELMNTYWYYLDTK